MTPRLRAAGVIIFCGFILVAVLSGCSADRYNSYAALVETPVSSGSAEADENILPRSSYVKDVPFYPNEEYQCGPSVLASVLNYLGHDVIPDDISREIYLQNVKGTLNIDMVSFANSFDDISAAEYYGGLIRLKEGLSMGYPVIVFVDLGIWSIRKGHYMLVVGYDDRRDGVIVYSGADRDKLIRYDKFMRIWKRGSYWALQMTKKN